ALLDATNPDLHSAQRQRALEWARGNPLALIELPRTGAGLDVPEGVPEIVPVPITERLDRAFSAPLDTLPEDTRTALLRAAAAGLRGGAGHPAGGHPDRAPGGGGRGWRQPRAGPRRGVRAARLADRRRAARPG